MINCSSKFEALFANSNSAELSPNGEFLNASSKFLALLDYSKEELIGKFHSMVCEMGYVNSPSYHEFWSRLKAGEKLEEEVLRYSKLGNECWFNATYTPYADDNGILAGVMVEYQEKIDQAAGADFDLQIQAYKNEAQVEKEKLTAILDGCVDAVVRVNELNIVEYWNPAAEKLWGFTEEEVVGKPLAGAFASPEAMEQHRQGINNYIKTGEKKVIGKGREIEITTKTGEKVPVLLTLSEATTAEGRTFTAFLKDMRAQKAKEEEIEVMLGESQAQEEELRQNMEEIQTIQEKMEAEQRELNTRTEILNRMCLVSETDPRGIISFINEKFCEVAQYTEAELIGKPHNTVRHPDMPKEVFKEVWDTIQAGKIFRGPVKNRAKDGTPYYVDAVIAPVLNDQGQAVKYVGVRYDITEYEVERQRMEGVFSAIDNSYAFIEFELDGTVIDANNNFLATTNYSLEEIKGHHHRKFVDPVYGNSQEYMNFWEDLRAGKIQAGQFERIDKNGKRIFLQASYSPVFDEKGRVTKIVKLATDITDFTNSLKGVSSFLSDLRNGNFGAELELKGAKAEGDVAEMIDNNLALRDVLVTINNEINRAANLATEEGKFNDDFNIEGVQGDWEVLSNTIRGLMAAVTTPINEVNRIVTLMAKGDLTQRFDVSNAKGDIAEMGQALNIALDNVVNILNEIEGSANTVNTSALGMSQKSEMMARTTEEVASAIRQMADGTQEQASRTDESSKLVEMILQSATHMGQKADIINNSAETGLESCNNGFKNDS